MEDTPAAKAGVLSGDQILRINSIFHRKNGSPGCDQCFAWACGRESDPYLAAAFNQ